MPEAKEPERTLEGEIISNEASGGLEQIKQMPYASAVIAWILIVGFAGGSAIYVVERGARARATWVDCVFLALNAVTATGLSTVDVTALRWPSLVLLGVFMQLGAATLLSLIPIVARLVALERVLPHLHAAAMDGGADAPSSLRGRKRRSSHRTVTFDLRKYRAVPQWLIEYVCRSLFSLAPIDVLRADSWTGAHLSAKSRSLERSLSQIRPSSGSS